MKNTLRVLERLSYINECALIDYTSEVKFELGRLIVALRSNADYEIADGSLIASTLEAALVDLRNRGSDNSDWEKGLSELGRTTGKLWRRIVDDDGRVAGLDEPAEEAPSHLPPSARDEGGLSQARKRDAPGATLETSPPGSKVGGPEHEAAIDLEEEEQAAQRRKFRVEEAQDIPRRFKEEEAKWVLRQAEIQRLQRELDEEIDRWCLIERVGRQIATGEDAGLFAVSDLDELACDPLIRPTIEANGLEFLKVVLRALRMPETSKGASLGPIGSLRELDSPAFLQRLNRQDRERALELGREPLKSVLRELGFPESRLLGETQATPPSSRRPTRAFEAHFVTEEDEYIRYVSWAADWDVMADWMAAISWTFGVRILACFEVTDRERERGKG